MRIECCICICIQTYHMIKKAMDGRAKESPWHELSNKIVFRMNKFRESYTMKYMYTPSCYIIILNSS